MVCVCGICACRLLSSTETRLAEFEVAALANLLPGKAEEAKLLIPSLSRLSDEELQPVLDGLSRIVLDRYNQIERMEA